MSGEGSGLARNNSFGVRDGEQGICSLYARLLAVASLPRGALTVTWQGSCTPAQCEHLRTLAASMGRAAEIGFCEGVSARALLSANPAIRVVSFELAEHYDLQLAKYRVDAEFPGRHHLVQGDSGVTVPGWAGPPFDLMFVDGDHSYEAAAADLKNSLGVVRPGGLIVCDDLTPWKPWGEGPARAWDEFTGSGAVTEVISRYDGVPGQPEARCWAVGWVPV